MTPDDQGTEHPVAVFTNDSQPIRPAAVAVALGVALLVLLCLTVWIVERLP